VHRRHQAGVRAQLRRRLEAAHIVDLRGDEHGPVEPDARHRGHQLRVLHLLEPPQEHAVDVLDLRL